MSCHMNINRGLVTVKETLHFGVLIVTVANGLLLFAVDFILSFTFFFFFSYVSAVLTLLRLMTNPCNL